MPQKNYVLITKPDDLDKITTKIIEENLVFAFDIETGFDGPIKPKASLHAHDPSSKVVGISFSWNTQSAVYVPLTHDGGGNYPDLGDAAEKLWRLLATGNGVAHNIGFELSHLSRFFREQLSDHPVHGAAVRESKGYFPFRSDTMLEVFAHASEPDLKLKELTQSVFNYKYAYDLKELFVKFAPEEVKSLRFNKLPICIETITYACEDSAWCLELHEKFYPVVTSPKFGVATIYALEMGIVPIVCEMEDYGLFFDWESMASLCEEAEEFVEKLDAECQRMFSEWAEREVKINLGSPKQVSALLFDELGVVTTVTSKITGKMSASAPALEGLRKQYPAIEKLCQWREVKKLIGSYLKKYAAELRYDPTGATHPSHQQAGAMSGRFSVSEVPYQQLPKYQEYVLTTGEKLSYNFRDFVIAPPNHFIIGFDYSQIELRMLASESGEPALIRSFENDDDVHSNTASLMLGIPREEITKKDRAKGKTLGFALTYGLSDKGLAERLVMDLEEAKDLKKAYFSAFSAVDAWMERVVEEGYDTGYARSRFGRKIRLPDLDDSRKWIRESGERKAVNQPLQSSAADYMKFAMIRVHKELKARGLLDRVHLVMNIHDALEFYVHESVDPRELIEILQPQVVFPLPKLAKIVADWHVGLRWGSMLDLKPGDGEFRVSVERDYVAYDVGVLTADWLDRLRAGEYEPTADQLAGNAKPAPVAVIEAPVEVEPEVGLLTITMPEMPTRTAWEGMKDLIAAHPGENQIEFLTPQGRLPYQQRTSLNLSDETRFRLILPGATVEWSAEALEAA